MAFVTVEFPCGHLPFFAVDTLCKHVRSIIAVSILVIGQSVVHAHLLYVNMNRDIIYTRVIEFIFYWFVPLLFYRTDSYRIIVILISDKQCLIGIIYAFVLHYRKYKLWVYSQTSFHLPSIILSIGSVS